MEGMKYELSVIACRTCGHAVDAHGALGCNEVVVFLGTYRCRCSHSAGDLRGRFHIEPRFSVVAPADPA